MTDPTDDSGDNRPIGIFDSGLGGISILKGVRQQLPGESVLYFADQGRLPYGPRPPDEIRQFSQQVTSFLLARGAKLVVVACNTASAMALGYLRQAFPAVPFVGMEPAVKPAAEQTRKGVIGVIATDATFRSERFAAVVERFARGVKVLTQSCPDLVMQVEAGEFDTAGTRQLLRRYLDPLLTAGIDSLVLGCTHYAFLAPAIAQVTGPGVTIVDPSPAVVRQVGRVIAEHHLARRTTTPGSIRAYTTAAAPALADLPSLMLGEPMGFEHVTLDELSAY